jgi:hypothetical protein
MAKKWTYMPFARPMDMENGMEWDGKKINYMEWLNELNKLADEGWEIACSTPLHISDREPWVEYMLRREKSDL